MKIEKKTIDSFYKSYLKKKENKIVENAATKNGVYNSTYNNDVKAFHNNEFSVEVKKAGITDQKNSGRCWIFAALNILKPITLNKLNVEEFEYSEAYVMFWEKMEKANVFLELIIEHPELNYGDRLFDMFLDFGAEDGGYWEWVEGLITKYGVVPKSVMPETYNSEKTYELISILKVHLLSAAKDLREAIKNKVSIEELRKMKQTFLQGVFDICAKSLGLPPKEFDFEYRDKDKKFQKISKVTPLEFLEKYASLDYQKLINVVDDPRKENPKNRMLVAKHFKGVIEGRMLSSINADLNQIKEAVIKQLKDGEPVWFDCDMGPFIDRKLGIMDAQIYQIDEAFKIHNNLTKEDRVNFKLSLPNHAMTLVGVDLDENDKPIKWEVENSWGDENGAKGYFSMSDEWLNEYCFGFILNPKYVAQEILDARDKEPIIIEPWDPLSRFF
ncbi:C1 family peptidase [Mycoplasma sp. Mirounga ES2805-ORL]|uniref:C1 family peptidase n=1 Tax=Mycoplasma sp. Mirounga ES2805-ORL TaxID=754514 RepID=UPI00197C3D2E|nr:C1 family peptidase [Mycoplasma sp. Mirounga ES2805-ORL]QSF13758.1 C1 family peptidase [Mycoplasma sp. Mirounga ES2805-ORL]